MEEGKFGGLQGDTCYLTFNPFHSRACLENWSVCIAVKQPNNTAQGERLSWPRPGSSTDQYGSRPWGKLCCITRSNRNIQIIIGIISGDGSGARKVAAWLSLAVWPWAGYSASLCCSSHICTMGNSPQRTLCALSELSHIKHFELHPT